MQSSPQYPALARLLALNNQVHDLENQLLGVVVPGVPLEPAAAGSISETSPIAALQEEIARGARASLAACWLSMPGDDFRGSPKAQRVVKGP